MLPGGVQKRGSKNSENDPPEILTFLPQIFCPVDDRLLDTFTGKFLCDRDVGWIIVYYQPNRVLIAFAIFSPTPGILNNCSTDAS